MVDEHKLLLEADRASKATALLDNDMLKEAFSNLEKAYIEKWRLTDVLDTASREKLHLAVNVIGKVREHLEAYVSSGSMAAVQLNTLAKDAERKKRFGIL